MENKMKMKMKTRRAGCLFSLIKLFVLTVIIAGALIYFSLFLIVPKVVHYAGKSFGIDMGLDSFSLAITEQVVELGDFYINNPEGFKEGTHAIKLTKARVDMGLSASDFLLKDLITVDEIIVDGFELSMEYAGGVALVTNNSNITAILAKLKSEEAKEEAKEAAAEAEGSSEKEYKIIIKRIVFKNGKVGGGISGVNLNLPLPNFEIDDIGVAEGGVSPLSAGLTILNAVSYQALNAIVKSTGGAVGDVSETAGTAIMDAGKATGNAIGDAYDAVKGLFDF